jgi:hypothetical protein
MKKRHYQHQLQGRLGSVRSSGMREHKIRTVGPAAAGGAGAAAASKSVGAAEKSPPLAHSNARAVSRPPQSPANQHQQTPDVERPSAYQDAQSSVVSHLLPHHSHHAAPRPIAPGSGSVTGTVGSQPPGLSGADAQRASEPPSMLPAPRSVAFKPRPLVLPADGGVLSPDGITTIPVFSQPAPVSVATADTLPRQRLQSWVGAAAAASPRSHSTTPGSRGNVDAGHAAALTSAARILASPQSSVSHPTRRALLSLSPATAAPATVPQVAPHPHVV